MIGLKTSVLLAASLKIGAILGGTSAGNADKLYEFGKALGIAFQLQDDYLDAFGESEKIGKQNGGDILANKKTFLYLNAMEHLTMPERVKLLSIQWMKGEEKIDKTIAMFRAAGADIACRKAVEDYSQKAFNALEDLACTSKRKAPLRALAEMLLNRQF
ncbi:MAG: polyprenyl synthetase family protein, partial [Chitinophagaceae bacterium]